MRRRKFITLLGGAAVFCISPPQAARAQQRAKLPTVGFVGVSTPAAQSHLVAALRQRLRELGWSRTIEIEHRWAEDMAAERLEVLREAVPGFRRLAILFDSSNPVSVDEARHAEVAAGTLGLEAFPVLITRAEDVVPAFDKLEERADALMIVANPLVLSNTVRINILAAGAHLPTLHRQGVRTGRRAVELRPELHRHLPPRRRFHRQDPAWDEARQDSGGAADQIRSRHQSHHCQSAQSENPESFLLRADEVI
jgi:hypothetical protein